MGYCVYMAGGREGGGRDTEERGNVDRAWGGRLLFFSVRGRLQQCPCIAQYLFYHK